MCKVQVDLSVIDQHWQYHLSRFQCLAMALNDLRQLERGNQLHYILDGYDFCNWFFPPNNIKSARNPYHRIINDTWNRFFSLSNGVETCAVLSPFTLIEFLHTITQQIDKKPIQRTIANNPDIQELLKAIKQGEKHLIDIPEQQQATIRNLYTQILDHKYALNLFSSSDSFSQLRQFIEQGKIRIFDPPVPDSAQVIELLDYDEAKMRNATRYLHDRRAERSGASELYNALDTYHFVLIENSRRSLSTEHIIPNLTSSGIYTRNSWYMLKYSTLPDARVSTIPADWNVRSSDAPALLLSALSHNNESVGSFDTTGIFLEDAKSIARMILQDLFSIPEIERCRSNKLERRQLLQRNPKIAVSSSTVELMRRLDRVYLSPIAETRIDIRSVNETLEQISKEQAEVMEEFLNNPESYEAQRGFAVEEVSGSVRQLNLPTPQLHSYIAPLGDDAEEFWISIHNALELP